MTSISNIDESRRQFLLYLLASGALVSATGCSTGTQGSMPSAISAGRSIHQLTGDVRVNGTAATIGTVIQAGDSVETFDKSFVIFVVD